MGKSFGEFSFFSDKPREISMKSEQVTHLAFISRNVFLNLLANFEEDFVKSFLKIQKFFDFGSLGKILHN